IAIVGRPNVGKSSLFNRIVGGKKAIVEDTPGVTRDRLYEYTVWDDKGFVLIDTGGLDIESQDDMVQRVKGQALMAVEEADLILFMMDGANGLHPMDMEIAETLRRYSKPMFYLVNKIDGPTKEGRLYEFYGLGVEIMPVSAMSGFGFDEVMDAVIAAIADTGHEADAGHPRVAIVGRPNVGKSSLVNILLGKERMIVSPTPGTTRDAVDSVCHYYGRAYTLIDTAGIRKKGRMTEAVERYAFVRTIGNIDRCDVALIVMSVEDGIVTLDQKIAGLVHDAGKSAVLLLNKWDLADQKEQFFNKVIQEVRETLWFMPYARILTMSALTRQRVVKLFSLVDESVESRKTRIKTSEVNQAFREIIAKQPPPLCKGKKVKIPFITQTNINPPMFVLFTNQPEGISESYLKYLERGFRERYPFAGTPIRLKLSLNSKRGSKK
ncbi:MAG TPA: ribosome biogenesis GTPase Der, partial [Thermodesulfovibrionia bacterium]|nr:ribosome biogenesis GTPase Der [Thermodesulfovibrionia bacterium]